MDAQSTTESAKIDTVAAEQPVMDLISIEAAELETAAESLEAVELELELQNQNLVSLGFEESIRVALERIGGEMLFQMRLENEDCQRVAAVRLGDGEQREFALIIMPPGGGLMRVEPVPGSTNPLARIAESYAGLMDMFKAAA